MRRSTAIWLVAVVACIVAGVVVELENAGLQPRHFGYYLAGASFFAGALFGLRGALLPAAGIVAFGVAALVDPTNTAKSTEDQTGLIVAGFFIYIPLMFGAVAAVGAAVRLVLRFAFRSFMGRAAHADG